MASERDPKQRMRRYYEEVWNQGNWAASAELVAEDVVDHTPLALPDPRGGRQGHDQMVAYIRQAFPDARFTIEQLVAEDDRVAGLWTMRATNLGSIFGAPPSGRPVEMSGIDIARWHDGRMTDIWHIEDTLSMLRQVGLIPSPAGP